MVGERSRARARARARAPVSGRKGGGGYQSGDPAPVSLYRRSPAILRVPTHPPSVMGQGATPNTHTPTRRVRNHPKSIMMSCRTCVDDSFPSHSGRSPLAPPLALHTPLPRGLGASCVRQECTLWAMRSRCGDFGAPELLAEFLPWLECEEDLEFPRSVMAILMTMT